MIRSIRNIILILAVISFAFFTLACDQGPSAKKVPPAEVKNGVQEIELTTITLTSKAEERLGIETVLVTSEILPGNLDLGGLIIAPPGTEIKVSSPSAGTIFLKDESGPIQAGTKVKAGQEIMRLLLMPPEKDLMGAKEELAVKKVEYDVAKAKMERAEQLLKDRAISEKAFQEAQAVLAGAQASLKASQAKVSLLNGADLNVAAADLSNLVLEAPLDGVVQQLYVASGQTVPASTLLFEVASQNPVWIRVPVYSGDVEKIDLSKNAIVNTLGNSSDQLKLEAKPIEGPPLSNSINATSDLYYEIDNSEGLFRVGMRVRVSLVKKAETSSLIVPWSSIVYDIHGGTWVYVKTADHVFSRRRVEMINIINDVAVLRRGVSIGDEVVTTAVAELYGTEFGGGK